MANTGNVFAGTGESVDRAGLTAWTTPGNVTADDAADATCNATGSDYLVARNFDFSAIPDDATIDGILVRVEASEHTAGTEPLLAQLQDEAAALEGASKSTSNEGSISGTAKDIYTYGSTSDLWGGTLTPAIVKDPNFGVRLWFTTAHDIRIDFVTMAVEYTEAAVDAPFTASELGDFDEPRRAADHGDPQASWPIFMLMSTPFVPYDDIVIERRAEAMHDDVMPWPLFFDLPDEPEPPADPDPPPLMGQGWC